MDTGSQTIHTFGPDGKYRSSIGRRGEGPGEFVSLSDICVDAGAGKLYVCSAPSQIAEFDLDGNFIRQLNADTEVPLTELCCAGGNFFMAADYVIPGVDRFFAFDGDMNLLNRSMPRAGNPTSTLCHQIAGSGDRCYMLDWRENMLYAYDSTARQLNRITTFTVPGSLAESKVDDLMALMTQQQEIGYIINWSIAGNYLL